mgnify:CR=1 FL=1
MDKAPFFDIIQFSHTYPLPEPNYIIKGKSDKGSGGSYETLDLRNETLVHPPTR